MIQRGLKEALGKFRGRGRLTADNIREGLREVRRAFLEADVNFNVTNDFIARVEAKAVGQDVLERVNPADQIIKIVFDELVGLMGPVDHKIPVFKDRPAVLMMCGLQGSGKTTTCGKLALGFAIAAGGRCSSPPTCSGPAAVEQLKVLGQQINIPVYSEATNPVQVCKNAIAYAKQHSLDMVILDTAGRLQIDDELMDELNQIDRQVQPDHVYLVVDAMIGQEAVNVAKAFNDALSSERHDPDQARRRRPRRGGPVDQGRHRGADQVHRRRREADKPWRSSGRRAWPAGSWARAT